MKIIYIIFISTIDIYSIYDFIALRPDVLQKNISTDLELAIIQKLLKLLLQQEKTLLLFLCVSGAVSTVKWHCDKFWPDYYVIKEKRHYVGSI